MLRVHGSSFYKYQQSTAKLPRLSYFQPQLGMMHLIETRMNNSNCLPMVKELLITYLLCSLAALSNRPWELRDKLSHARRGHFPVPPQHVPGMSEFSYLQLANVSNASFWEKCMHILGIHRLFLPTWKNPEESYVYIWHIYMIWRLFMIIRLIPKKYYASLAADHPNFCIETTLTSPDSTDVTTIQIIQAVSNCFNLFWGGFLLSILR